MFINFVFTDSRIIFLLSYFFTNLFTYKAKQSGIKRGHHGNPALGRMKRLFSENQTTFFNYSEQIYVSVCQEAQISMQYYTPTASQHKQIPKQILM